MIPNILEVFNNYLTPLKLLSVNKIANSYMSNSMIKAVNFDAFCKKYCSKLGKSSLCSNDALFVSKKNDFTFIEFKNGSIESENIRNKINESLHIFNDTINENLKYDREHVDYILVYNPLKIFEPKDKKSNSLDKFQTILSKKAESPIIKFGVQNFENLYFRKILTLTTEEFDKYISEL